MTWPDKGAGSRVWAALHQLLYFAGWLSQLDAQGPHGPLVQDAATEVQLLQAGVGAEHEAEVFPPLANQGLGLHPASEKERNICFHGMDFNRWHAKHEKNRERYAMC